MRAKIGRVKRTTVHWVNGVAIAGEAWLEIREAEGLFFLLRLDRDGRCLADTCHFSLDEAQKQAAHEYDLDGDWIES